MINLDNINIGGGKLYFGPALSKEDLEKIPDLYSIWSLLDYPVHFLEFDKSVAKQVIHTPIADYSIPKDVEKFSEDLGKIISHLGDGKTVYLHCFAGHGRTGMALACLIKKFTTLTVDQSLTTTKNLCGGPESKIQIDFVRSFLNS